MHLEVYSQSNVKSLPLNITKNIYRSASKLHDDRIIDLPTQQSSNYNDRNTKVIQQETMISNEMYDRPKSYDNISSIDRNNNYMLMPPQPRERTRNENENT